MDAYFVYVAGALAGSFLLGIIAGSSLGKRTAFKQMIYQQAHNDLIKQFTESLNWKENKNVSQDQ
jgi:hypothetical protein